MQGASPLASPGDGRDAALKVGGMRRPAGACPGRHGQVNSGSPNPAEAAKPILQHPTSQPPCRSAGEGRNRARTPDPINHNLFGKVLGGSGGLLKESPEPPRTFLKLYLAEAGWWGGRIPRPAGACPGRHGQVNSGSPNPAEAAKPILQHPTSQPPCRSAGEGRNRARTPDPINHNLFGKVLGGLGDSFKSPPALPRASPAPPQRLPTPPQRFNAEKQARAAVFFRRL